MKNKTSSNNIIKIRDLRKVLHKNPIYQLDLRRALVECADTEAALRLRNVTKLSEELVAHNIELACPMDCALNLQERLLCGILDPESDQLKDALRRELTRPHQLHNRGFGRYVASETVFQSVCEALNWVDQWGGRKAPYTAVHATPGLGKSALLDHLAYCVTQYQQSKSSSQKQRTQADAAAAQLLCNAISWPEHSVVISITFNNFTSYEYVIGYHSI